MTDTSTIIYDSAAISRKKAKKWYSPVVRPISRGSIEALHFGENVNASIPFLILIWAYSIAVERVHGMDEVGVRLPVGPHLTFKKINDFLIGNLREILIMRCDGTEEILGGFENDRFDAR